MKFTDDFPFPYTTPLFFEESQKLRALLSGCTSMELKKMMKVSDKLLAKVEALYKTVHPEQGCALLSYSGIAFQYMAPHVFDDDMLQYVQNHLRILSGMYGILRPFDQVEAYRLEMQTKLLFEPRSLYAFWGARIADALEDDIILNLASEEYAKTIRPYKKLIDVRFLDVDGKEKGVYAKMARGEMVRYMAEHRIESVDEIKQFDRQDYRFCPEHSSEDEFVFQKTR